MIQVSLTLVVTLFPIYYFNNLIVHQQLQVFSSLFKSSPFFSLFFYIYKSIFHFRARVAYTWWSLVKGWRRRRFLFSSFYTSEFPPPLFDLSYLSTPSFSPAPASLLLSSSPTLYFLEQHYLIIDRMILPSTRIAWPAEHTFEFVNVRSWEWI